jgi:hypothetical protein
VPERLAEHDKLAMEPRPRRADNSMLSLTTI